jgi:hypothetical protein
MTAVVSLVSLGCRNYLMVATTFLWRPFLLRSRGLLFGLGKLDCDKNRKISRNKGDAFDQHHRKLRVPIRVIAGPLPCLGNVFGPGRYPHLSYLHDYLLPPTTTYCLPRLPTASHDYLLPPTTASLGPSLMTAQNLGDFQNKPDFADAEKLFYSSSIPGDSDSPGP